MRFIMIRSEIYWGRTRRRDLVFTKARIKGFLSRILSMLLLKELKDFFLQCIKEMDIATPVLLR